MFPKVADGASIVLVGSFNPGIFHPTWFEKQELLPVVETQNAQIEVISNDVAIFVMSWVRIEVLGERFVARTIDESKFGPLRDLIVGTFRLLEHTPVTQVGLNREIEYQLPTEVLWHNVGHKLAPKEPWLPYVKSPGMKSLLMEAQRDDDQAGVLNITVKPVVNIPSKPKTVHIQVNDHVELGDAKTALDACKIIEETWDTSLSRATKISEGLILDTTK